VSRWGDLLAEIEANPAEAASAKFPLFPLSTPHPSPAGTATDKPPISKNKDLEKERERESLKYVSILGVEKVEIVEIEAKARFEGPPATFPSSPVPSVGPLRRAASISGAQRFADSDLHDKALALGWSWDELYGDHGAARVLGNDRALYVTRELIMACSPLGEAKPIYRGVDYGA
jgi:hypothetical protein